MQRVLVAPSRSRGESPVITDSAQPFGQRINLNFDDCGLRLLMKDSGSCLNADNETPQSYFGKSRKVSKHRFARSTENYTRKSEGKKKEIQSRNKENACSLDKAG
jgi:hypothetical protein